MEFVYRPTFPLSSASDSGGFLSFNSALSCGLFFINSRMTFGSSKSGLAGCERPGTWMELKSSCGITPAPAPPAND